MPNRNYDNLSELSFFKLCRLCCYKQRLVDVILGLAFLGASIYFFMLYRWAQEGSVDDTWKEYAPLLMIGFIATSAVWFVLAYFRSPLAWVRGEPEDSEMLMICIKRCFCCRSRREPPRSTVVGQPLSRPDPDNFSTSSANYQRSMTSILYGLYTSLTRQAPIVDTNTESVESDRWPCIRCIWCQKSSNQELSASTTEDLTQSSSDPTDDKSSPKEDMEMMALNVEQQGSSSSQVPADVENSPDSGNELKKRNSFQYSEAQENTGTTNKLTQSSTDPTNFDTSSSIDIEMGNGGRVQSH